MKIRLSDLEPSSKSKPKAEKRIPGEKRSFTERSVSIRNLVPARYSTVRVGPDQLRQQQKEIRLYNILNEYGAYNSDLMTELLQWEKSR